MKTCICFLISLCAYLNVISQTISPAGPVTFCVSGTLTVTGATGSPNYQWQLNGVNVGSNSPTHNAIAAGNYTVILSGAPPDTLGPVAVSINPPPVPSFTFNNNNTCSGTSISFNSTVTSGTPPFSYSWDFGDGNFSTGQTTTHNYTALGCGSTLFTAVLTVTDALGCVRTSSQNINVLHAPDVRLADIDIFGPFSNCENNPTVLNPNYTLTLNNTSPNPACITTYTVNWGDGNTQVFTAASFPISHTYTQLGAYNLSVTAMGTNGCSYVKTYVVANQTNPAGGLGTLGQTTGLCAPSTIPFIISNWQNNSPGTIYVLQFGDGNQVTLTHPLNATNGPDTVNHQYTTSSCPLATFTATLLVINACDTTPYTAGNIQIRISPAASFTANPNPGCAGNAICFTNTTVPGTFGGGCLTTTAYSWNFGDPASGSNNTSTLQHPCHTYSSPGTYTVTLTSSNPCGPSVFSMQVCVASPPVPDFIIDVNTGCAPLNVMATNTSTVTNSCSAVTYLWSVSYASGFCNTASGWSFTNGTNANSTNPSFQFTNGGTYTITLAVTNPCGTFTTTRTVTVKRPPTVTINPITSACAPSTIHPVANITNCGSSVPTYLWTMTGATPSSSTNADPGNIVYNTPGTYTITLDVTNECGTTTASQQVTVSQTPDINVLSNVSVCAGATVGSFTLTSSTPGATFNWTNSNTLIGLAASGSNGNIPAFTATNTGASPITGTINSTATLNGCSSNGSFTITVNPLPAMPVASNVTYCQNATATALTATALSGHTLLWYTVPIGGTGSATAPVPSTSTVGSTTHYVSQVNTTTNCEGPRRAITVTINISPLIGGHTFINPATCASSTGSITLTGLGNSVSYSVSYTFNSSPITTTIVSTPGGNVVIPNLAAGSYDNIQVTVLNCTSPQIGPVTLSDPAAPAAPAAGNNSPVCSGQNITLTSTAAPAGATYNWSGPGGYSSNVQNPVITAATTGASGTYTLSHTQIGCTSPAVTTVVVVNPTPALPTVSSNSPVCSGNTLNLNASTTFAGAATWQWNGPNAFTSALQNPTIPNVTTTASGNYTVTITANTGVCVSPTATIAVTVRPTPTIANAAPTNPSQCSSATGSITLTGLIASSNYVVTYTFNTLPQTVNVSSDINGVLIIPNLEDGIYDNIIVTLNGCPSLPAGPVTLTDPSPPLVPGAASSGPVCSGNTLTLTATNNSAGTPSYSWTGPNGFASNVAVPQILNVTTAASGTYLVTVTINGCTSPAGSVTVLVDSTPVIPTIITNSPVCSDSTLTLSATTVSSGSMTWSWSGPNGFTSTLQNPVINNVTMAANGNYSVTVTAVQGTCSAAPASVPVIVNLTPVILSTSFTDPTLCNSATGTITLNGLASNASVIIHYLHNGNPQSITLTTNGSGSVTIPSLLSGTYSGIYVIISGCRSLPAPSVVLTDPNPPAAPAASSTTPVCSGQPLTLSASTTEPGTTTWSWTGPDGFTSVSQNPTIAVTTAASAGNYQVSVTINNCMSLPATTPVVINPLPALPAVITPVQYCIGALAQPLTATPAPGNPLNWYTVPFGGTPTAIAPVPSTTIAGITPYYVSQTNSFGCEGPRDTIHVIINQDAIAFFNPSDTIKCPPFDITPSVIGLQLFPANNSIYDWYANGVSIGSGTTFPGYTILNENSTVNITLITTSLFGCKPDTMSQVFNTYNLPHPSFNLIDTVGCGPLSVLVQNTTPNIGLFTYFWDFDNGQTSTAQQPGSIVFLPNPTFSDTIYNVSLQIFSICDTITVTRSVRVKSKPKALFTPSQTTGCSPMDVVFQNTSLGSNSTYYWDFGDGTTLVTNTLAPVSHTYNTGIVDTFTVQLIAINECGSDSIQYDLITAPNNIFLNFAVNGQDHFGCAPHTVAFFNNTAGASSFSWDFGDGNVLSTIDGIDTVYHTYLTSGTFTVTLTAMNNCTDTTTTDFITVFPKPQAAFTASQYTACQGLPVSFTNQSTGGTSYLWEFGDGATSVNVNPTHTYTTPGLYNVKLTVFAANAPGNICNDTLVQQVQIVSTLPGSFSMSDTSATCAPLTINFANQNLPSVTANWDFGDGTFATGNNATHTYTMPGIYNITLTVTVPGGCTYVTTRIVTIGGPGGSLQYTGGFHCYPDQVRLEATGTGFSNLIWNFGDGNTLSTTQQVVFHTYTNPGAYVPSVSLQNTAGCNFNVQGIDTIKVDRIDAGFTSSALQNCGTTKLIFDDTSHVFFGIASVGWDFGDGTTGTGGIVTHDYMISGNYTVQMIITGNSGCADTITKVIAINVNSLPVVNISGPAVKCTGEPVDFTSVIQSTDPITFMQWTIPNGVNTNTANLNYTFTLPGTYIVTFIAGTAAGCFDTTQHTIVINQSPAVTVSPDVTICLGNSTPLVAQGAAQYQWSPPQGLSCTSCPNPIASPIVTTPYLVAGTNTLGCTVSKTVTVTVIQPLNMTVSPNDTICIGGSANLLVSGAASYIWTPAQGLSSTTISNPVATPTVTTMYRVVGYDGFSCFTDTAFILVAVGEYPTISLGPDLTLSTGTIHPLNSTVTNGPVQTWTWTPTTDLNCSNCSLPNAHIKKDITYIVNIRNIYGCAASDTISIKVFCTDSQMFIPNAFTPDGDGINDILMVRGKGIVSVKSFRIFNRWGEVVFDKYNFPPNSVNYGWNGKIKGVYGPPDVFVYTAEVICENGTPYTYKGNVSIIK